MVLKKIFANWHTAAMLLLLFFCICFAGSIQTETQAALTRCMTVIIPSLYAMMILSQILLESGIWRSLALPFRKISIKWFGISEEYFGIFLLSQFAGYPVGAGMLCSLVKQGDLSRRDAERLLCVCYGGGPAFLLGLLGDISSRMPIAGVMYGAILLTNLLFAAILFHKNPIVSHTKREDTAVSVSAQMLVGCTASAGKTLLRLCGVILSFSAVCGILQASGLLHILDAAAEKAEMPFPCSDMLCCLLEISNCTTLSIPFLWRIPFLTTLLSFGGVCVLLQVQAVIGDCFSMKKAVFCRIAAGVISGILCGISLCVLPVSLPNGAVMASAVPQVTSRSTFPVLMLLCMMLLVFREEYALQNHKKNREIA